MEPVDQSKTSTQSAGAVVVQTPSAVKPGQVRREQETGSLGSQPEHIKPSETGPEIPSEVTEAGVEAVSELPTITSQHERIGIIRAKESIQPLTASTGTVSVPPLTQIEQELRTTKPEDGRYAILKIFEKLAKRMGLVR